MLPGPLHLHETLLATHDNVHVHRRPDILLVIEIQAWLVAHQAYANRSHPTTNRSSGEAPTRHEPIESVGHRDTCSGDRRSSRAPVSLKHVAVQPDRVLSKPKVVEHGTNAPSNESLNL